MHSHGTPTGKTQRVLQFSLLATLLYVVLTFFAGLHAHSLALISEAGHNVSDAAALLLSFVAVWCSQRPPNEAKTFGYQRTGVLAAFFNSITLVAIAIWIGVEAIMRLRHPQPVATGIMMIVATAGMLMNGLIAALLWRTGAEDLNLRSTFIHMLGDAVSTGAVIVGGAAIYWTGIFWLDPALSLAIAALILWSSISIARESLNILLEGTPNGLSLAEIRTTLNGIEGVEDVHDLHVWSLGSQTHALSTHICIADIPPSESNAILERVRRALREKFRITHTTVQFENRVCQTENGCSAPLLEAPELGHHHHHGSHSHAH